MNLVVDALFHEYLRVAGDDKITAAILTLADVLAPSPRTEIVHSPAADGRLLLIEEAGKRLNLSSRQVYKKVLRNGAVGVFQGKILVNKGAQKTDGYQISQSLLLDDDSQFLAKPELEIYADDVACSHGSTSGAIDEEGLFYLRSRGVPKDLATDLMVIAFVAEALEEIEDAAIAADVLSRLEGWLERRRG